MTPQKKARAIQKTEKSRIKAIVTSIAEIEESDDLMLNQEEFVFKIIELFMVDRDTAKEYIQIAKGLVKKGDRGFLENDTKMQDM